MESFDMRVEDALEERNPKLILRRHGYDRKIQLINDYVNLWDYPE